MPFWLSCSLHNTVLFQHPNVQMARAGSGASSALWHHTAQMNKSYKETLQSLLFHLRGEEIAEVAWSWSSFWALRPHQRDPYVSIGAALEQHYP